MMITEMITEKNIGLTTSSLFEQMLFPFKETIERASAVRKTNQLKKS